MSVEQHFEAGKLFLQQTNNEKIPFLLSVNLKPLQGGHYAKKLPTKKSRQRKPGNYDKLAYGLWKLRHQANSSSQRVKIQKSDPRHLGQV